jgi:hypothetical protein
LCAGSVAGFACVHIAARYELRRSACALNKTGAFNPSATLPPKASERF